VTVQVFFMPSRQGLITAFLIAISARSYCAKSLFNAYFHNPAKNPGQAQNEKPSPAGNALRQAGAAAALAGPAT
jgi:hypothetical protein